MMQAVKENWWHTPDLGWRGAGGYCATYEGKTTGYFVYTLLEEYNTATGVATGKTKPNGPGEPEYISPFYNVSLCPLPPVEPEPEPVLGWRGLNLYCLKQSGKNTGFYGYTHLEQYDESTGMATGVTKANSSGDPDYIAPVKNEGLCPIPAPEPVLGWRPISPYCIVETSPSYTTCQGLDLAIVLDITGSMQDSIDNIRTSLNSIVSSISNKYGDYRISLSAVHDNANSDMGNTLVDEVVKFSLNNKSQIQEAINSLEIGYGGSTPEPHDVALSRVLSGIAGPFRDKVTRTVIIVTDAPSSGYDDTYGPEDLQEAKNLSQRAKNMDVRIFPIIVGNDSEALQVANAYVSAAKGSVYRSSNGLVSTQIISALTNTECIIVPEKSGKTGYQGYQTLQQYNVDTGVSTGVTKPNSPSDPNYFYPVYAPHQCYVFTITPISKQILTPDFTDFYIQVESDVSWSVISKPGWVIMGQSSGTGNANINVSVNMNRQSTYREGFIVFSAAGSMVTFSVRQEAGEAFPPR